MRSDFCAKHNKFNFLQHHYTTVILIFTEISRFFDQSKKFSNLQRCSMPIRDNDFSEIVAKVDQSPKMLKLANIWNFMF